MTETEGDMWARLGRAGTVLDWANGPTVIDFNGKVSIVAGPVAKYGETYVWYGHDASLDIKPEPDPKYWPATDSRPDEKAIRADERKLCVEALKAEAREYREYADRTRDDGRYLLSMRFRSSYLGIADAYERAALMLERRHV